MLLACDPLTPGAGLPEGWEAPVDEGQLRLERQTLDFGTLSVLHDDPVTMTVMVSNVGSGTLSLAGLALVHGDVEAFHVDAPALVQLAPNESTPVTVTFQPAEHGVFEASVVPNGLRELRFRGVATAPAARMLADQDSLGVVPVGCSVQTSVVLMNEGSEPLLIEALELNGTSAHALGEAPSELGPEAISVIPLSLAPLVPGAASATLRLISNDPAGPLSIGIDALATSGGSNLETVDWLPPATADLLFVVDTEAVDQGLLVEAQAEAKVLFQMLGEGRVDWRVSAVDGAGCHATYDPWLDASVYSPSQAGPALGLAFSGGSPGTDALLDLALDAIDQTGGGGCLQGFFREGAQHHVVLVGAREEASLATVSDLEAALPDLVVSAVMGEGTGSCEHAGAGAAAAEATDGIFWDLCDGDWDTLYTRLARTAWGWGDGPMAIEPEEAPAANTLRLSAQDGRVLKAWTWDGQVILLDGDAEELELLEGVELRYELAQTCPQ